MEYGKQLNPEHSLRTPKGIKGTRQKVIVTHNPSEIDQAQEPLVSVATFATFVGIPVSVAFSAASMTGAIASGIISTLTKKYQKKLKKVTRLIDIITPALVAFERVIYGALKNGIIDEEEFNTLQTLHLETLNELTGVDHRMEVENRSLVEKA